MAKPVILCVDDESIILNSLKKQLYHGLGDQYQIELAESGEEALEVLDDLIASQTPFPLIIADQIMDGMYGDELLAIIKQKSPDTLSILLTGQATTEAIGQAVNKAGLYRYFSKPWDADDLILTVESALKSFFHKKELDYQHMRNRVLNEITRLVLKDEPLEVQLNQALHTLLTSELFSQSGVGTIDLADTHSQTITFTAQHPANGTRAIPARDLSLLPQEIELDAQGTFCAPLKSNGQLAGVLQIKTTNARQRSNHSRLFLSSVGHTLAGMIQLWQYNEEIKRHNEELEAKVKKRTQELNDALRKQEQLNDILLSANAKLDELATTDELTGLLNRRSFFDQANDEVIRSQRYTQNISVMVLDIDFFKSVNDTEGHHAGDLVLIELSKILQALVRKQDIVGRFGGDEFAIVLPETNLEEARSLGERIRATVAESSVPIQERAIEISISMGLTLAQSGEKSIYQAMVRADKALYQSKAQGRNQVSVL